MRAFDCPYLVTFIGVAVEDDCVMLVTEYMDGGDLFQGLHGPRRGDFAWNATSALCALIMAWLMTGWNGVNRGQRIALDIARGLEYLHRHSVIHLVRMSVMRTHAHSLCRISRAPTSC